MLECAFGEVGAAGAENDSGIAEVGVAITVAEAGGIAPQAEVGGLTGSGIANGSDPNARGCVPNADGAAPKAGAAEPNAERTGSTTDGAALGKNRSSSAPQRSLTQKVFPSGLGVPQSGQLIIVIESSL